MYKEDIDKLKDMYKNKKFPDNIDKLNREMAELIFPISSLLKILKETDKELYENSIAGVYYSLIVDCENTTDDMLGVFNRNNELLLRTFKRVDNYLSKK